jgi:hypothetical protein
MYRDEITISDRVTKPASVNVEGDAANESNGRDFRRRYRRVEQTGNSRPGSRAR